MKKQSHTDLKKVFKSIDNAMDDPKHLEKMKKLYSEKGVLQPSPALLVKLGSITVHADE
ncbi:MAG: hypothetical protein IMZ64_08635, partial [Bacteroidetes bacterium]|nr:hypothetical protein [Bacteroidota bacterium]